MNIIDIQPYFQTEAEKVAEDLLMGVNSELLRRIAGHRNSYNLFWRDPVNILAAMGKNAAIFLAAASKNIEHISALAQIAGKTINDFMSESEWKMQFPIKINLDGSAVVKF